MLALILPVLISRACAEDGGGEKHTIKYAHSILAVLAWVVFFPLGSILMRILSGQSTWLVHAAVQGFTMLLLTASAGLGIQLALNTNQIDTYHAIIGLTLFGTVWVQATGGYIAHVTNTSKDRTNIVGLVHVWLGRTSITLGMINGGLGLLLAGEASKGEYIAYGVIAGLIWLAYMGVAVTYEVKRMRGASNETEVRDRNLMTSGRSSDVEMQSKKDNALR